ncbi:TIGR02221 family CRISPR-associated protein [Algivirga pacifica]|uniref:CRISPR-associated protein, TM1812 family n=1 Tax=Algivirga pacifica TaxID=1162670 RepID=A0ABP9DBN3_9BACT
MPRKVLISFLGAGRYETSRYYHEDVQKAGPFLRYVQEATARAFCKDWNEQGTIIVFTTEKARETHWNDNPISNENEGLQCRLKALIQEEGFKGMSYKNVMIPDGLNEEGIWAIFETVFRELQKGDEVIFDITHAFRSIPMLGLVLLNYGELLKDIKTERLCYGAFEARDTQLNTTPIVDLTSFVELQKWTGASRKMIHSGDTKELALLLRDTANKYDHLDKEVLLRFAGQLTNFSEAIATCRGRELSENISFEELQELIEIQGSQGLPQLVPLLELIKKELQPFKSASLKNGLAAVKWCLDHNMIQQGYTFLQETIKSLVIEQFDQKLVNEYKYRELVNQVLAGVKEEYLKENAKDKGVEWEFVAHAIRLKDQYVINTSLSPWQKGNNQLVTIYRQLSKLRNDINHCGTNEDGQNFMEMHKQLYSLYRQVKELRLDDLFVL